MARAILIGSEGGVDTDELTAIAPDVLENKTAYVKGSDDPVLGAMPNRGAVNQALNAGNSYTIPIGYHNGSGKVTANSLASQTGGATATDDYVCTGYTYWKDGSKRTGSMSVSSLLSFSTAPYSTSQVTCAWTNPVKGPYSGVIIRYKIGGYPASASDGILGYKGAGSNIAANGVSSATVGGLAAGTTYHFRIFTYATTSLGELGGTYWQSICTTTSQGQTVFTQSQTWAVPDGVRIIDICCVGGGGGGGGTNTSADKSGSGGGGGGGGYVNNWYGVSVTHGQVLNILIGSGGFGGAINNGNGGGGGVTSVGGYSAAGGNGNNKDLGGNGGSGGGKGGIFDRYLEYPGGAGGADGANGLDGGGIGQGRSTRAFGSTLYAGGGGGGASRGSSSMAPGGAGGGGNGGYGNTGNTRTNGADNTGSGGGGSNNAMTMIMSGGSGGSGIAIIRWGY